MNLSRVYYYGGGQIPTSGTLLDRQPLFPAVESNNTEIARMLLEACVDVNAVDALGSTALHIAVKLRSEQLVMLLLEYGADINA